MLVIFVTQGGLVVIFNLDEHGTRATLGSAADEDRPTRIDMFDVATEVDKTLVAVAQAGRLLALDEPVKELCDSGPKRSTAVHQSFMQIAFQP